MTVEQLLIPRIKIINDWPGVAGIVIPDTIITAVDDLFLIGGEPFLIDKIRDYPYLFKEIHWSEEREEKDMPEWVKIIATGQVFKSYGFGTLGRAFIKIKEDNYRSNIPVNNLTPTTEQEYNEYINSKK